MIIVAGTVEVDPADREAFLNGSLEAMRSSRAESGNLEYTLSPDPVNPGRVMVFERWESDESLNAHLSALRAAGAAPAVPVKAGSITVYDIAGERPLPQ